MPSYPRPEYPRPQFTRPRWLCLNGEWEFEIDSGDSGLECGLLDRPLAQKITVPFCPESTLSGVGNTDFMNAVWYRRRVTIPADWAAVASAGNDALTHPRILLHFQAVDYDATVWVNGVEVGRHRGGFTPFTCDLTRSTAPADNTTFIPQLAPDARPGREIEIVVRARDPHRGVQPRGKQSEAYANRRCHYTRTTGIWQTVWLEPVPTTALQRPRLTPDLARGSIILEQNLSGPWHPGLQLRVRLSDADHGVISNVTAPVENSFGSRIEIPIPPARRRLWSPEDPHLYNIDIELLDTAVEGFLPPPPPPPFLRILDHAQTYAGLRSISIEGHAVLLNGRRVFQRLVLDQGFYPDGLLTAPDDAALVRDIELSLAAGFNGARLHQKVFEERFLYHADRLGYLVWGEFPDWGCNRNGPSGQNQQPDATYITQWLEAIERDYSHPSIIGWCPLNETWQAVTDRIQNLDDVTRGMFLATKLADRTRPVIDASGYSHRVLETDIYDSHDYEQNPQKFAANHVGLANGAPFLNREPGPQPGRPISTPYAGQPFFISEFGGIWWNPAASHSDTSWGYGKCPASEEEFYERFAELCRVLLENPRMFGYCYTQLTDVFQEQNGIYRFDRTPKFDLARLRSAQLHPAAIENDATTNECIHLH
ncbi:beta-galactosidase [Opitutaceae bacterium TAV4]|nr:beta-galactosidase [Opitutaceae bacterium TAV4]